RNPKTKPWQRLKFENDDFVCRRHILNPMSNLLFDVYHYYSTAKELWNALEERYFTEDATKSIQVTSIINKLPSTWKDGKKNLKHRQDALSLKDLGKHLLIEERFRLENKTNDDTSKVHVMEEMGESSKADGMKHRHDDNDKKKSKKIKKDVICYNCKNP
nr:hypothetical protein [Tanacetum cinerariifolium]